jgi:cellulose biosynthesis protein BcsQ
LLGQHKGLLTHHENVTRELTDECERFKADLDRLQNELDHEQERHQGTITQFRQINELVTRLQSSDVKLWERDIPSTIPPFVARTQRQVPIVSLLNLKGGVGKTTLTANLGAAFAAMGRRVLLIDLDYQNSLSTRCLSYPDFNSAFSHHRLVEEVLRDDVGQRANRLLQCLSNVVEAQGQLSLLACSESFETIENASMMRWWTGGVTDDVRFRLRQALHDPKVTSLFDIILLDCPPRLTTGCVNALTASDFALVPVLLEEVSTEAVPRLLRWVRKLKPSLWPDLEVLGVAANKVKLHLGDLVKYQRDIWNSLPAISQDAWGSDVHHFDQVIPQHNGHLAHRFAALDPRHSARFLDLADATLEQINTHASRTTPAIYQSARSTAS